MNKEIFIEVRENFKKIYTIINHIINSYENQKENLSEEQKNAFISETMLKLSDISSITQINIHNLDMILSIDNIKQKQTKKDSHKPPLYTN